MKRLLATIALLFCATYLQAQRRIKARPTFEDSKALHERKTFSRTGLQNVILGEVPVLTFFNNATEFGVGISYERFITRHGLLSFIIPFYIARPIRLGFHKTGSKWVESSTQFIAPGIRFHPLGNEHRADLSIGFQCAAGSYELNNMIVGSFGTHEESQSSGTLIALLGEANINLYPSDHFVIGFRIAYGSVVSESKEALTQIGFKIGARF